jgi:pterin-4a-carbinolamine dehydratase
MADQLSDLQIDKALTLLDGWSSVGETIARQFEFPDFVSALGRVSESQEAGDVICFAPRNAPAT